MDKLASINPPVSRTPSVKSTMTTTDLFMGSLTDQQREIMKFVLSQDKEKLKATIDFLKQFDCP